MTIRRGLSLNSDLEIQLMEKRLISLNNLQAIRNEKTDSDKKLVLLHKYLYTLVSPVLLFSGLSTP